MPRPLDEIAREYAERVEHLVAPPTGTRTAMRSASDVAATVSDERLTAETPRLALDSEEFNVTAAQIIKSGGEAADEAALSLLSKARTDLDIARLLLQKESPGAVTLGLAPTRTGGPSLLFEALDELKKTRIPTSPDRAGASSADKKTLVKSVDVSLRTISAKAAEGGHRSIRGVIKQGFAALEVAGHLGLAAADLIGVGTGVRLFVQWAQRFLSRAYDAVVALLGTDIVDLIKDKLGDFFKNLSGVAFEAFTSNTLYGITTVSDGLQSRISGSSASKADLAKADKQLGELAKRFPQHIRRSESLLKGLDDYAGYATGLFPKLGIVVAVVYTLIGGYILATGADYVDASTWKPLDRVAGVRRIVEAIV